MHRFTEVNQPTKDTREQSLHALHNLFLFLMPHTFMFVHFSFIQFSLHFFQLPAQFSVPIVRKTGKMNA